MYIYFRSSREGEESKRTGRQGGRPTAVTQTRNDEFEARPWQWTWWRGKYERDSGARTEALVFSEQMWVKRKGPPPARFHVRVWMPLPQEAFPDPPAG